jgi:hypothetical protein
MRTTIIAAGTIVSLGVILAACSGGGSSSAPATVASPIAVASMNPNQVVNTFTGPSSQLTVSIKVPARTTPSAALMAHLKSINGMARNDKHLRMMSNTSPTASLRALGMQQHIYAGQVEASTRRDPTFISGATEFMEFVISSGATVLVDDTSGCNQSSCTANFTVPVGTNYTATLYLYDDCGFLIAAGSVNNLTVNAGNNTPLTITLNGLVAYFNLSSSAASFIADPSQSNSNVTITGTALDWDGDVITTPGVLLDSNFNQITGLTLTQDGPDVTPASAAFPLQPNLSFGPSAPFSFAGTGSEPAVNFTATEVSGSQIVPNLYNPQNGSPAGTNNGVLAITDNPVSVSWVNNPTTPYPISGDNNSPLFIQASPAVLEFPTLNGDGTVALGLSSNAPAYTGNVTITDNGACGGIVSYNGASTGYQMLAASPFVVLTSSSQSSSESSCALTATVNATGQQSVLQVDYDSSTVTIQNKVRGH